MTDKPFMKTNAGGTKEWYLNDKLHREDGPAVEWADGDKCWYLKGKLHREDGPAREYANGDKRWYLNGKRHREDGPAVEYADGDKRWYLNGKRHREDGPAVEHPDGSKSWYLNDTYMTEEDFRAKQKQESALKEICGLGQEVDASDNVNSLSTKSDGGPSSYYDMPFQEWMTLNDQMEYLAQNKWGIYAIHLKDVFKGLGRWGDKEGTTPLYDTKKGIYYFCRVMKMMVGAEGLRDYLQSLLDDPQFKGKTDG
jgi:hypothetical protein